MMGTTEIIATTQHVGNGKYTNGMRASQYCSSNTTVGLDGINGDATQSNSHNEHVDTACKPSLLIELSQIIAVETEKLNQYLQDNHIPIPSFEPHGFADFPRLPEQIQKSRKEIVRATNELSDLIVGPTESMRWMGWDHNNSLSLRAVNQFKMANAFPFDSTATFGDIADTVGIDEMNVRRFLRHAMTNRIFREVSPGVVAHTAASKALAENQALQDWLGFSTEDMWPAAAATIDAMLKYPGSQENDECGFQVAFGTEKKEPMFATFGKDPVRGKRFGGAMQSLCGGEGYEVKYFIDNYDMMELNQRGGMFADVGGSHGFVCVDLAKKYDKMRFVVQDLPKMVNSAPAPPGELAERIKFEGHDFYTPQTLKDADVYFFRWIFHNQSDNYAIQILKNLIPGLKNGAKIVINDHCLPEPGQESLWDEKIIRTMDLVMLTLLNAQERSASEFESLFAAADERYHFLGITRPIGCRMSIVEAVWWEDRDYGLGAAGDDLHPISPPLPAIPSFDAQSSNINAMILDDERELQFEVSDNEKIVEENTVVDQGENQAVENTHATGDFMSFNEEETIEGKKTKDTNTPTDATPMYDDDDDDWISALDWGGHELQVQSVAPFTVAPVQTITVPAIDVSVNDCAASDSAIEVSPVEKSKTTVTENGSKAVDSAVEVSPIDGFQCDSKFWEVEPKVETKAKESSKLVIAVDDLEVYSPLRTSIFGPF